MDFIVFMVQRNKRREFEGTYYKTKFVKNMEYQNKSGNFIVSLTVKFFLLQGYPQQECANMVYSGSENRLTTK